MVPFYFLCACCWNVGGQWLLRGSLVILFSSCSSVDGCQSVTVGFLCLQHTSVSSAVSCLSPPVPCVSFSCLVAWASNTSAVLSGRGVRGRPGLPLDARNGSCCPRLMTCLLRPALGLQAVALDSLFGLAGRVLFLHQPGRLRPRWGRAWTVSCGGCLSMWRDAEDCREWQSMSSLWSLNKIL